MKIPLSWIKDFVDITLPLDELTYRLTMAGLEVEEVRYVGLPMPDSEGSNETRRQETKITGFAWEPDKIVVAEVSEVMPHPNADRLVLCRLNDGEQENIVLTGATNLFPYKGKGALDKSIKVAYAKEGARIYDGHQPGHVLVTLKRTKIRGVESFSMACSEKELGISDEHEGIIILDDDAQVGMPLVEYMGDVVLDIAITPNIARDANVLGVAREIAALTGQQLHQPDYSGLMQGAPIEGRIGIEIEDPELNPRFVVGLIENIRIMPSPYWVQRRLRLAGIRSINNVVDATNYAMFEIGEPLHAFDYDVLVRRANGKMPTIITRRAVTGEKLKTLDDVDRKMDDFSIMVCDTAGALSIAGVMGGAESEVNDDTRNILLEGAAWNMINIRRTVMAQNLPSEAAYRFSRGVHPAMAERGVRRGLEYMRQWSGGVVAQGLVDNYPNPPQDPMLEITADEVERWLGVRLTAKEIGGLLKKLEFEVDLEGEKVCARVPDHRLDIGIGVTGTADLIEEIARVYGYDRIPETRLADALPPQRGNMDLEKEEQARDVLVSLGLQEVVTYRMTAPEREGRLIPPTASTEMQARVDYGPQSDYVRLQNPIASDRNVLRKSLLSSVVEVVERNARLQERHAFFEIGQVYLPEPNAPLPVESRRLVILLSGPRAVAGWQAADTGLMDFYDLKGMITALARGLHLEAASGESENTGAGGLRFLPDEHPTYYPGKCARIMLGDLQVGIMGELHPLVREGIEAGDAPILAVELELDAILEAIPTTYPIKAVPVFPPVLEDLAIIVDESTPAEQVAGLIRQAGGKAVQEVRLFDVYRGDQIGTGKKSLAYSVVYQSAERTLTDQEVAQTRNRIVRRLEQELNAKLRS
jgi:phenylalanyl-tRNA synthetase beta chain